MKERPDGLPGARREIIGFSPGWLCPCNLLALRLLRPILDDCPCHDRPHAVTIWRTDPVDHGRMVLGNKLSQHDLDLW